MSRERKQYRGKTENLTTRAKWNVSSLEFIIKSTCHRQ